MYEGRRAPNTATNRYRSKTVEMLPEDNPNANNAHEYQDYNNIRTATFSKYSIDNDHRIMAN